MATTIMTTPQEQGVNAPSTFSEAQKDAALSQIACWASVLGQHLTDGGCRHVASGLADLIGCLADRATGESFKGDVAAWTLDYNSRY